MARNSDYVVQMREPEFDRDCLRRPLFKVNMRLFKSSQRYREHIQGIIKYMVWILGQQWDDYQSNGNGTFGISCANLGMAYNIIGYRDGDTLEFMINPTIAHQSDKMIETKSNCGSIKFKEKIPVMRPAWVIVDYYDINGNFKTKRFTGKECGFTIQHEIDHNNGILITDRFIDQGGDPRLLDSI